MKKLKAGLFFSTLLSLSACNGGPEGTPQGIDPSTGAPIIVGSGPTHAPRTWATDLLIYDGVATASGDAESLTAIAENHGLSWQTVNSSELNSMSLDDLSQFGAIVWPGGYATQMSNSLTLETRDLIRRAVVERGVGFLGICAGAFIAVSPLGADGHTGDWGLSIIPTTTLPYYHLENEGTDDAMVDVFFGDGVKRNLVWWGGPTTPEWKSGVAARYQDDHSPAVSEGWAGNGFVVLVGPHPEAPMSWRTKLGLSDSDGLDSDWVWLLMHAAFRGVPLKPAPP